MWAGTEAETRCVKKAPTLPSPSPDPYLDWMIVLFAFWRVLLYND